MIGACVTTRSIGAKRPRTNRAPRARAFCLRRGLPQLFGVLNYSGTFMTPKTLYEKIWDNHVVYEEPGKPSLIYIDRHLIHEGTSPQAFAGLKSEGRKVRRPDLTFAVMDHSVPTKDRLLPIIDQDAKLQFDALAKNCAETGVRLFDMNSKNQGIVHIIGPELGITQPGQTVVCGDSHT